MKINVFGATGELGSKIVLALLAQGFPARGLIASGRNRDRLATLQDRGIAVRRLDYDEPSTLGDALAGTDVLMLVPSMAGVEPRVAQHARILGAAAATGVRRIVLTSFAATRLDSRFQMAPFYLYAESKLRLSGMQWTVLRNGIYLDPLADWAPSLAEMGRLPYPVRHGRVAYVARADLARASAAACLDDAHAGRTYELTGPHALSMPELAAALSAATGRPIRFDPVEESEFAEICRTDGVPEFEAAVLTSMYRAVDNGEFAQISEDIRILTGTPPEDAGSYLHEALKGFRTGTRG